MLIIDRERIRETSAVICWADTGKQFPEMYESIAQIESLLGLKVMVAERRISFDEFLFERGGMIRKGTTDCSRRMKRSNLSRLRQRYPKPWEINLGFNADEEKRANDFTALNERDFCHWRFPLLEAGITREETWNVCRKAGFTILVGMYEKMGRFDCYWCGNQKASQALKVVEHYPDLAAEWMAAEAKKGHGFRPIPLAQLIEERDEKDGLFAGCSCFGGNECEWDEED